MELRDLQKHIKLLATLDAAAAPVVSCYLNVEAGDFRYRKTLDERVRLLKRGLSTETLRNFEEALGQIEGFLAAGLLTQTKRVAMFARGGERPYFLPLQFGVPLPNWIGHDSVHLSLGRP